MNFKRFSTSDNQWYDVPYYQHKTATDTLTLPATLYPNDTSITVGVKGNEEHTGTPSPQNPVVISGTGERTENLINVQPFTIEEDSASHNIVLWSGTLPVGTYTIHLNQDNALTTALRNTIRLVIGGTNYYESATVNYHLQSGQHKMIFSVSDATQTIEILYWGNTLSNDCSYSNIMLNTGSTALPYEPYGFKIPISSANTTTPVYLGEAETTRKIKKLVLTGNEPWQNTYGVHLFMFQFYGAPFIDKEPALCTEYMYNPVQSGINIGTKHGEFVLQKVAVGTTYFYSIGLKNENYSTVEDFKLYLQQQYVAGTPVTVWYVLATEETAIVNEPLVKIGDYADTLSNISIPVTAGGDTISVDTTVQPSGVAINYKGWHNAKCKEYSYNMTIADWESASISQMENHTIQELQGGNWV